jgi:hypothetical protein
MDESMFIQHFVMLKYWLEVSGRRFPTLSITIFVMLSKPSPNRRVLLRPGWPTFSPLTRPDHQWIKTASFPFTHGENMSHKTLHRVLTALTLTLAALLTTTQVIAAPKTEGKKEAVKPAKEGVPPFCTAVPDLPDRGYSCESGKTACYVQPSVTWACCYRCPDDLK